MKNVQSDIKLAAIDLLVGQSARILCPVCGGGSTSEKSMVISRTAYGLAYCCFRDTCRSRGVIGSNGPLNTGVSKASGNRAPNTYDKPMHILGDTETQFLQNKFFLSIENMQGIKVTESGDIMYPMRDNFGRRYGYINRRYIGLAGGERKPKSIMYFDDPSRRGLHFPHPIHHNAATVVLVEDWVSARRVADHTPCVALLGTNLSDSDAMLLSKLSVSNLVFALDPDANKTSVKLKQRHALLFNTYSYQQGKDSLDPKDQTPEELEQTIKELNDLTGGLCQS